MRHLEEVGKIYIANYVKNDDDDNNDEFSYKISESEGEIEGEVDGDKYGSVLALSSDGLVLATGNPLFTVETDGQSIY